MSPHPSEHDEHVTLRLALHAIIAPKRPIYSRSNSGSSSVSGTASPMSHNLTSHRASAEHHGSHMKTSRPVPVHNPHLESAPPSPLPSVHSASPASFSAALPVNAEVGSPHASQQAGGAKGHGHVDFVSTLQGKSAWDALIHGSWV